MDIHFIEGLRKHHEEMMQVPENPMNRDLSVFDFCRSYGPSPDAWRIGPFTLDGRMTFRKVRQWKDRTGLGWTSASLFNPSCLLHEGRIHMAYRASPRKESLCSRIGIAVYEDGRGWTDAEENPVVEPTEADEMWGCEDPKLYRLGATFFLFYQAVFQPTRAFCDEMNRDSGFPIDVASVAIKVAVSQDLVHWSKRGVVVPTQVTHGFAKGAAIPRDAEGRPIAIGGEYLMYISSGCGGKQTVGFSKDLLDWRFETREFLVLPEGDWHIEEVACISGGFDRSGKALVMDFYYQTPDLVPRAGQALYSIEDPFRPLAIRMDGGTLSWGGMIRRDDRWYFAQGWDAPAGVEEIYFYSAPVHDFSLDESQNGTRSVLP